LKLVKLKLYFGYPDEEKPVKGSVRFGYRFPVPYRDIHLVSSVYGSGPFRFGSASTTQFRITGKLSAFEMAILVPEPGLVRMKRH